MSIHYITVLLPLQIRYYDIQHKRGDFIGWINNLIVNVGKWRHMVEQNIFNSQRNDLYGCKSWNHMDLWVDKFRKTWNNGVRRVFSLHDTYLLIEWPCVTDQMRGQFYKMILSMLHNENDRLTYLTQRMIQDSCSIIACNIQVICKQYGKNAYKRESLFNLRDFKIKIKQCDIQTVVMIRELQDAMQDDAVINVLSEQEMNDILYSICCD